MNLIFLKQTRCHHHNQFLYKILLKLRHENHSFISFQKSTISFDLKVEKQEKKKRKSLIHTYRNVESKNTICWVRNYICSVTIILYIPSFYIEIQSNYHIIDITVSNFITKLHWLTWRSLIWIYSMW